MCALVTVVQTVARPSCSRFLVETFEAVRAVWPERLPLTLRLGVIESDGREETFEESIALARRFAAGGLDLLDVSLGFNIPGAGIPWGPAFMAPLAERSEEHTSELQSLMRISYAVFCLKKKKHNKTHTHDRYTP